MARVQITRAGQVKMDGTNVELLPPPPPLPDLWCKVATATKTKCGFTIPFDGTRSYPAGAGYLPGQIYRKRTIIFSQSTTSSPEAGIGSAVTGEYSYTSILSFDLDCNINCDEASGSASATYAGSSITCSGDMDCGDTGTHWTSTYSAFIPPDNAQPPCLLPGGDTSSIDGCNSLIYYVVNLEHWMTWHSSSSADGTCSDSHSTRTASIQLDDEYTNADLIAHTKGALGAYSGEFGCDCFYCPFLDDCVRYCLAFTLLSQDQGPIYGAERRATVCTAQKIKYKFALHYDLHGGATLKWDEVFTPQFVLGPTYGGALEIGKTYFLLYSTGDDFSNVGASNVSGSTFVATGSFPRIWTNGSVVFKYPQLFDGAPYINSREFTFDGVWSDEYELDAPDFAGTIEIRNLRWA